MHAIAYFLYYHEMRNFIKSFFLDFLQKGLFFHFWFFGSLIILYFLLPILRRMEQKTPRLYIGILAFLGGACICIDGISMVASRQVSLSIIQHLDYGNGSFIRWEGLLRLIVEKSVYGFANIEVCM